MTKPKAINRKKVGRPDNMGYYLFNDTYNAYVEILSFSKIIKDSKKRNRILFDKRKKEK